ncbi:hypothetical protein Taro_050766 [Colocasia esculenta]|uniref:Uncharacterized protein n=1 Tax=Colocasia esculenta TaxID=4460 RepID=A0A843XE86_COLES|nr:hypothetical protein [Colocasia esculenta]
MWQLSHGLRSNYNACLVVAAPRRWMFIPLETSDATSNVVNISQKKAGLRYLSCSDYLWEVNFDLYLLETPDVGNIPQLRIDCVLKMLGTEARFEIVRAWNPDFEIGGHRGQV